MIKLRYMSQYLGKNVSVFRNLLAQNDVNFSIMLLVRTKAQIIIGTVPDHFIFFRQLVDHLLEKHRFPLHDGYGQ